MKRFSLKLLTPILIACFCWVLPMPMVLAAETPSPCPSDMVYIPGGTFTMGSDNPDFVEEKIAEDVTVSSFCIEPHEVTNAQFAKFVDETGYITVAELPLSKEQFPDLSDVERAPGSLVFKPPEEGIQQVAYLSWWHWTTGQTGDIPLVPTATFRARMIIPWSISPMKMP
jgi:sulfatase modifying factor 1